MKKTINKHKRSDDDHSVQESLEGENQTPPKVQPLKKKKLISKSSETSTTTASKLNTSTLNSSNNNNNTTNPFTTQQTDENHISLSSTTTAIPLNNIGNNALNITTPVKTMGKLSMFQKYTPAKSSVIISSPIKIDIATPTHQQQQQQQQQAPFTPFSSKKLVKPIIDNVIVPQSPSLGLKLKEQSTIRPLLRSLNNSVANGNNTTSKQHKQLSTSSPSILQNNNLNNQLLQSNNTNTNTTMGGTVGGGGLFNKFMETTYNNQENLQTVGDTFKINEANQQLEIKSIKELLYNDEPDIIQCNQLPIDHSIKNQLTFTSSSFNFNWCSDILADRNLTSNIYNIANSNNSIQENNHLFLSSLVYFISPSSNVPWEIQNDNIIKDNFKLDWMENRWNDWYQSFESIYNNLKLQINSSFYLIHQEWCCHFTNENGEIKAKLNPTTRKIRQLLTNHGIQFTTPFIKTNNEQQKTESKDSKEILLELKELLQKSTKSANASIKAKKTLDPSYYQTPRSSSIVMIEGHDNVEKLYQMFKEKMVWSNKFHNIAKLTNGNDNNDHNNIDLEDFNSIILCKDAPQILSTKPFIGSTLKLNKVKGVGEYTTKQSIFDQAKSYRMEIEGPLLPDNYHKLINLLSTLAKDFTTKLNTLEFSFGFNTNNQLSRNVIKNIIYSLQNEDGENNNKFKISQIG